MWPCKHKTGLTEIKTVKDYMYIKVDKKVGLDPHCNLDL